MNIVKVFLIICNLFFAYIATFGFNQKIKNGKEIGEYESIGCVFGVLMYVFNAIFIWI